MKYIFDKKIIFSFLTVLLLGIFLSLNQVGSSADALAIRVINNNEYHYSAIRWYKEQGFTGSPQAMMVDGYEAVRDGRTVYVNAANIGKGKMYTNIYLISYNQEAEQATQDIFGQLLKNWKFNTNISNAGQCVKTDGYLSGYCLLDSDCSVSEYCNSKKAEIVRDVKRWSDLTDIRSAIEDYQQHNPENKYPKLDAGTYLKGYSLSVWPSWRDNFSKEIGINLPIDPINKLGSCGQDRFNSSTCWDEQTREFAFPEISTSVFPDCFRVISYKSLNNGQGYNLCAVMESGYIWGLDSGACATVSQLNCEDRDNDGYDDCKVGDDGDDGKGVDCNDSDSNIYPGAYDNNCNGIDEDCDGNIDDNFSVDNCQFVCQAKGGESFDLKRDEVCCGDEQNEQPYENPERSCSDGNDNDCDGEIDIGDAEDCPAVCTDNDGDYYIRENVLDLSGCGNVCGPSLDSTCLGINDCDDSDATVYPGNSSDICDGKDNDCSGTVDNGFTQEDCQALCTVNDNDWMNDLCCGNNDYEKNENGMISSSEVGVSCNDKRDNDCDGYCDGVDGACFNGSMADTDCLACVPGNNRDESFWAIDNESGGYTCNQCGVEGSQDNDIQSSDDWSLYPGMADRCDSDCGTVVDTIALSDYEDGTEKTCDNIDNNCDGTVDEGCDDDGDGYCSNNMTIIAPAPSICPQGGGDGDDNNPAINPSTPDDNCNGIDENSDGQNDEGYVSGNIMCGVGACQNSGTRDCVNGKEINNCSPRLPTVTIDDNCDGLDDDCDGLNDEDYGTTPTTCGTGACARAGVSTCLGGAVINTCTSGSPAPNDATCDGADNDCDGLIDEDFTSGVTTCGVGICVSTGSSNCSAGTVTDTCTPGAPNPGLDDNCDGLDDDCDGSVDEDGVVTYYADVDADGYGDLNNTKDFCGTTPPVGYVADGSDCDDSSAIVHPGATEVCDGLDNDCDPSTSDGSGESAPQNSNQVGVCATLPQVCVNGSWNNANNTNPDWESTESRCDNLDNDCDGSIDEDGACCGDNHCGSTDTTTYPGSLYDDAEECSTCYSDCGVCPLENDCGVWLGGLLVGGVQDGSSLDSAHVEPFYDASQDSAYIKTPGVYNIQQDINKIYLAKINSVSIGKNTTIIFSFNNKTRNYTSGNKPLAINNCNAANVCYDPYSENNCFNLDSSIFDCNVPLDNMSFWVDGTVELQCN